MPALMAEKVVMTPTQHGKTKSIHFVKKAQSEIDFKQVEYGGQTSGLVVQRKSNLVEDGQSHLQLEFRCFLVNQRTRIHVPENRVLRFWFRDDTEYLDRVTGAYEFVKELIRSDRLPRDYVGFLMLVMKQLKQERYDQIKKIVVDLTQLDEEDAIPPSPTDKVVMTPTQHGKTKSIHFIKKAQNEIDFKQVEHSGQTSGLVVQRESNLVEDGHSHLQLEFRCFLVNQRGIRVRENRVLRFWFRDDTEYLDRVTGASEFFKELIRPDRFPRDYVGFLMLVMKQLKQEGYDQIKKIVVDLTQLDEEDAVPSSPSLGKVDRRPRRLIVQEQLLLTLESAYPNVLPIMELARMTDAPEAMIKEQLKVLKLRNLIKEMEPGKYVRKVLDRNTVVKVVKEMHTQTRGSKPTIAIITSKFNEKLAVDSMMENKTTFVKYKTEGEANVYTIGMIGHHKVVSTKLPMIGRDRSAQISVGSATNRLLGTFSDIEHVLLVGVAGGVPHYADYFKHVRLGDVIVSTPNNKNFIYLYCERAIADEQSGAMYYTLKSWNTEDLALPNLAAGMIQRVKGGPSPWDVFIQSGQYQLKNQEVDFTRPSPNTDKLYIDIGIEVTHPAPPSGTEPQYDPESPVVRLGAIGSGKSIVSSDTLRTDFAGRYSCIALDDEFDQVLESIEGNRKESFCLIRGVADYLDGTKNTVWQPYAALAAAAVMKSILLGLPLSQCSAH